MISYYFVRRLTGLSKILVVQIALCYAFLQIQSLEKYAYLESIAREWIELAEK